MINTENFLEKFKEYHDFLKTLNSEWGLRTNLIDEINQKQFIKCVQQNRFVIIKTARQVGLTTMLATLVSLNLDKRILFIAPRLQNGVHFLKTVENVHGSKIESDGKYRKADIRVVAPNENAMKGYTPDLVIIDQAVFIKDFDKIWSSLAAIVSVGGHVIIASSPTSPKGTFYKLWNGAENDENSFYPLQLVYPFNRTSENYKSMVKLYGGEDSISFRQEILAEFCEEEKKNKSTVINVRISQHDLERIEDKLKWLSVAKGNVVTVSEYLRNLIYDDLENNI